MHNDIDILVPLLHFSTYFHQFIESPEIDLFTTQTYEQIIEECEASYRIIKTKRSNPIIMPELIVKISFFINCTDRLKSFIPCVLKTNIFSFLKKIKKLFVSNPSELSDYIIIPKVNFSRHFDFSTLEMIFSKREEKTDRLIEDLLKAMEMVEDPRKKKKPKKRKIAKSKLKTKKKKPSKLTLQSVETSSFVPSTSIVPFLEEDVFVSQVKIATEHSTFQKTASPFLTQSTLHQTFCLPRLRKKIITINLSKLNHIKLKILWLKMGGMKVKAGNHFVLKGPNGQYCGWGFDLHGRDSSCYSPRVKKIILSSLQSLAVITNYTIKTI